ncbi:UDP-N-acetylmuramoyl-tripeptide--D-alanyl-D-alanine ligase [invertebrate metagenome]|uniref:UDP-MurNAc-pentapeptide synthetase n=1 Tax=invertebrate metagenome TaxID=1711999 RepID=A0A2H9TB59_9ZZZZ
MMNDVTIGIIAAALAGKCVNTDNTVFKTIPSGVSIDSRSLSDGDVFVAIRGPRFDGHDYGHQAMEAGASLLVVDHALALNISQIVVSDTFRALGQIGALVRSHFSGTLFGVTGSCGKTSVKEMLASVMAQKSSVLATQGNLNNGYGVPLMLSRLDDHYESAVIEMGTSSPGEIAYVAGLASPDISIITNAAESHLRDLKSVEGVAHEKGAILDGLGKEGSAVLNIDDPHYGYWKERAIRAGSGRVVSFSKDNSEADFFASDIRTGEQGMVFSLHGEKTVKTVHLQFWGAHQVQNACSSAAAAFSTGVSMDRIVAGLASARPFSQRGQRYVLTNGTVVFDETYNANPHSTRAAIDLLAGCPGQKILVLGDMLELGENTQSLHTDIGYYAKSKGIDTVLGFGEQTVLTVNAFGVGHHFDDKSDLIAWIEEHLSGRETVLVKGSKSMAMQDVVRLLVGMDYKGDH